MFAFRLPVSRIEIELRQPAGADDVLLAEADGAAFALAEVLVGELARPIEGGSLVWADMTLTDLDAALLAIRRLVLGDRLESSARCAARADGAGGGCGARIDLGFHITDYLAQHRPRMPRGVTRADEAGWFRLDESTVSFRLPTAADLEAIAHERDAAQMLAWRCIRPDDVSARLRRRIERAMDALAPNLYGELEGVCPECGATVAIAFDPQRYVLAELRQRAAFVFEEVHLIAGGYRWSEQEILRMPRARRARYAELIHDARSEG
jgi:hypothetical protein